MNSSSRPACASISRKPCRSARASAAAAATRPPCCSRCGNSPACKADDAKLAELAARLGSDIPFFIYGRPAVCRGRGEIIEPVRAARRLPGPARPSRLRRLHALGLQDLRAESAARHARTSLSRLHRCATISSRPPSRNTRGCRWPRTGFAQQPETLDALMSGSGSSVFALTASHDDAARAANEIPRRVRRDPLRHAVSGRDAGRLIYSRSDTAGAGLNP